MAIVLQDIQLHALNLKTRMPFRYGIATLTEVPYVFVAANVVVDGKTRRGLSADILPPKWFTKVADQPFDVEIAELIQVIRKACEHAEGVGSAETVFEFWRRLYAAQKAWGESAGLAPLLTGFGASLIERAVIDAHCRATGISFAQSIRENTLGVRLGEIFPALEGMSPADLLPQPRSNLSLRHTVGLADPLTDGEIPADERLDDGLPQSLEACIQDYGLTHFKIKITADAEQTIEKMTSLSRIIRANCDAFAFTLDGNECFQQINEFRDLWAEMRAHAVVGPFLKDGLLAVEQPLHRDVALNEETQRAMLEWTDRPAIIIDESGGDLESLPRALECGYAGTSHKNCKGVFPGVANACLLESLRRKNPDSTFTLTGEDLMNVGPVALLQDLAVAATLGIEHIERNGHHYVKGLSAFPEALQQDMLCQHGDLYRRVETAEETFASLRVANGEIYVGSVLGAPFGHGIEIDLSDFDTLDAVERAMARA